MAKIVVFDSGLGSLSLIRPLQQITKSEIIYFADQKNFPYGKKSKTDLHRIINETIKILKQQFNPDVIVIASNTPSLLLTKIKNRKIIYVLPPLKKAVQISRTKNIAILSTESVVKSRELSNYIKQNYLPKQITVYKINASPLVSLVESGKFITNQKICIETIRKTTSKIIYEKNIDVVTLSSTHLPFLQKLLEREFPNVTFLDPGNDVAKKIAKLAFKKKSKRNSLKIFTSGNTIVFGKILQKIGIKNKVNSFF